MSTSTSDANPADDPRQLVAGSISNGVTGFGTANNWNWEMTLGLTPGTGDFAQVLGSLAFGGTLRGAFTVQSTVFPAPNGWLPVDVS